MSLPQLRLPLLALTLGVVVVGSTAAVSTPLAEAATAVPRPFASTSPFNVTVAAGAALDPLSASMVAHATRTGMVNANLFAYAVPIYAATASTPTYAVTCSMEPAWGTCPFRGRKMPIPNGAVPSAGSDKAMVVVDAGRTISGEYWQATRSGASTGAGASRLGGVIRVSEIKAGRIDHALVLQSDNVCREQIRPPAIKTDGDSSRTDCIPEGARLQLDPSISVTSLPGITPGEKAVARALQLYGAYVIDRGGAPLAISFERAPDATASNPGLVYTTAGLRWDYDDLPHIPWSRLRVLKSWDNR
jgi:hypothetical protein